MLDGVAVAGEPIALIWSGSGVLWCSTAVPGTRWRVGEGGVRQNAVLVWTEGAIVARCTVLSGCLDGTGDHGYSSCTTALRQSWPEDHRLADGHAAVKPLLVRWHACFREVNDYRRRRRELGEFVLERRCGCTGHTARLPNELSGTSVERYVRRAVRYLI